jgi:hypothetical protein
MDIADRSSPPKAYKIDVYKYILNESIDSRVEPMLK